MNTNINTKNQIRVYIYTAWNGYDWQGCETGIATDLRRYLEATDTMPKTSGDKPPFGGVIACQIGGKMGVGFYTYMLRKQGDIFGRDSLYVAFAFIPKDFEYKVDFAKMLADKYMREPQEGEIKSAFQVDCSNYRLEGAEPDELNSWWETPPQCQRLQEPDALTRLSFYFQSEKTQLGLLRAVIKGEAGTVHSVTIDYQVFGEVSNVAKYAEIYRKRKKENNGVLAKTDATARKLQGELDTLRDQRASKLKEYTGLVKYIEDLENEIQTGDQEGLLKKLNEINTELENAIRSAYDLVLEDNGDPSWHTAVKIMRQKLNELQSVSQELEKISIDSVPRCYREVQAKAIKLTGVIARAMALCDGADQVAGFLLEEGTPRVDFFGQKFFSWMTRRLAKLRENDTQKILSLTVEKEARDRSIADLQNEGHRKDRTIYTLQADLRNQGGKIAKLESKVQERDKEIAELKDERKHLYDKVKEEIRKKRDQEWQEHWRNCFNKEVQQALDEYRRALKQDRIIPCDGRADDLTGTPKCPESPSVFPKESRGNWDDSQGGGDKIRPFKKILMLILAMVTLGLVCLFMKSCGEKAGPNQGRMIQEEGIQTGDSRDERAHDSPAQRQRAVSSDQTRDNRRNLPLEQEEPANPVESSKQNVGTSGQSKTNTVPEKNRNPETGR